MRLYLPESWTADPERLEKAGVPDSARLMKTKGEIALELLDLVRSEGLAGRAVVADSGYGVSKAFRDGLAGRELHYVVGVTEDMVVFTEEPRWVEPGPSRGGRPRTRPRLSEESPRPATLKDLASSLPREEVTWRRGTKGDLRGKLGYRPDSCENIR
jgi:SRSO17 transposase